MKESDDNISRQVSPPPKVDEIKESKTKKKKKKNLAGICLVNCRYDAVRRCAKRIGLREMGENDRWTVYWTDCSVSVERCTSMKSFQRINHFPSMTEICRKDLLSRNLTRMLKQYPKDYDFFPRTWILPADQADLLSYMRSKKKYAFICKPQRGCQGRGIFITRKPHKDLQSNEKYVIQQYLEKPLLIDGFKFDLRVYALVTSCDPLRVYVYHEGLARFATTPYTDLTNSNMSQHCMHLTNYSINKFSDDFIRDDDECGSKRKFSSIHKWFEEHNYDYDELWRKIDDIIVKTLIAAHPIISHSYRTCFPSHTAHSGCFEILGFDILIDRKLTPWILEVNHSPSFHTDSDLDKEIKEGLLYDTLNMLHVRASDRTQALNEEKKRTHQRLTKGCQPEEDKKITQQKEEKKTRKINQENETWELKVRGGFRQIYPTTDKNKEKYSKFFTNNTVSLLQTTASAKAREEASKALRLNLEAKNAQKNDRGEATGTKRSSKATPTKTSSTEKCDHGQTQPPTAVPPCQKESYSESKPIRILTNEEIDRQRYIRQRHIQFRDMGGIDFVYRVLHCTRGTVANGVSGPSTSVEVRCVDPRCPYQHSAFNQHVTSEQARAANNLTSRNGSLTAMRAGGGPPILGPSKVLRQKPFSFTSSLNNSNLIANSNHLIRNIK